jgi:F0F1-type ATP synthase assembly protein I
MIEPGQAGAYLALFSEIGIVLLVTTLIGALAGNWIDKQVGTSPFLLLAGFLLGAAVGARAMYQLITRFLAKFD